MNHFTIHEDKNLRDRPFMRTCVPKGLQITVNSFELVRNITWPSASGNDRPDVYADQSYIKFSGDLRDKIAVFSMSSGEVATFNTLINATIRPLPPGQIGGKNKATFVDGLQFSGMSSREVPEQGLMTGEPGYLVYLAEFEYAGTKTPTHLSANLYLDEDKFFGLFSALSNSVRPVETFHLYLMVELFESEISASLSEPWMSRDYGILLSKSGSAYASARIESISVSTAAVSLVAAPECEVREEINGQSELESRVPTAPQVSDTRISAQLRHILIALVVLIGATIIFG